ncbi:hypothetical protein T265_13423, partial [Opisthorchis viverrini]
PVRAVEKWLNWTDSIRDGNFCLSLIRRYTCTKHTDNDIDQTNYSPWRHWGNPLFILRFCLAHGNLLDYSFRFVASEVLYLP